MPAAPGWCLDGDVIVLGALRVTVERMAASHWRPDARLRSWGPAPLRRENDAVLLPCAVADLERWDAGGEAAAFVEHFLRSGKLVLGFAAAALDGAGG